MQLATVRFNQIRKRSLVPSARDGKGSALRGPRA
jgi:hypothetical protein